jgi:hypothetical protein
MAAVVSAAVSDAELIDAREDWLVSSVIGGLSENEEVSPITKESLATIKLLSITDGKIVTTDADSKLKLESAPPPDALRRSRTVDRRGELPKRSASPTAAVAAGLLPAEGVIFLGIFKYLRRDKS